MIKPYYKTDLGVLYHGDCLTIMPHLEPVDLVLTDPPYGINAHTLQPPSDSYRKRTKRSPSKRLNCGSGKLKDRILNKSDCGWDCKPPTKEYFKLMFAISQNQIIWGGNYFQLPPTRGIIVWDKQQPWDNFSQCELGWTSYDFPAKIFRFNKSFVKDKKHPTQKPIGLMVFCLEISKTKGMVLDTHLGSGTTAIACERLNRRWIGIEIGEKYCEIAAKRIEKERSQLKLFT